MLVVVDEHAQLTTINHMNPINQWSVDPHYMTFSHTALVLPFLSNIIPAMVLQNMIVRLNIRWPFQSGIPPSLHFNLPSGLGRRVVGVVLVLLLLLSGDIETNPGPVGEFLC